MASAKFQGNREIGSKLTEKSPKIMRSWLIIFYLTASILRFTLNSSTRIIQFRGFLSQFSTNFHKILHTLFLWVGPFGHSHIVIVVQTQICDKK